MRDAARRLRARVRRTTVMTRAPRIFYGWYVVAATFLLLFGSFGAVYSFGAFFLALSEEFGAGRAAISGVFSGAVFTLFITGAFSGMLADRFGPRPVIGAGIVAIALGFVSAAGARELWQLLACYTFGVGIGFQYTAAGFGSVIGPVLAGYLFDIGGTYTFALIIGALCSAVACYLVTRMPEPTPAA